MITSWFFLPNIKKIVFFLLAFYFAKFQKIMKLEKISKISKTSKVNSKDLTKIKHLRKIFKYFVGKKLHEYRAEKYFR